MREIFSDNDRKTANQIGEEAAAHFITSKQEYEDTNPSIWDADEEITFDVPIDVPEPDREQKADERRDIRAFKKQQRKDIQESKHTERSANHIIDKGIRAKKSAVRRDIAELDRMEIQDKLARIEESIKDKF